MDNRVYHQYKNKKFDVAIGFPCDGLGDTICATPSVRKLSEAYNTKITVYSKHPVVFQNLPYVKSSHRYMDIHDNQELKDSFDYFLWYLMITFFAGLIGRKFIQGYLKRTGKQAVVVALLAVVISVSLVMMGFVTVTRIKGDIDENIPFTFLKLC